MDRGTSKPRKLKIKLTYVKSSAIKSHGYHLVSQTLRIKFPSGAVYDYAGVQPEKHAAFAAAESFGRHFMEHIRGRYESTRIDA